MDVYPLNLILAVATASATIFLGFLPTKTIRSPFFAKETLKAAIAWLLVAVASPPAIIHYHLFIAILCGGAWWKFRRDNALSGKMWLSIASGLGISIGVMLILAVTPEAYPPGLTQPSETLLLASIYLGGALIGLAYTCYILSLSANTNSGVTHALVQRYTGLLFGLTLVRAGALLGSCFLPGVRANSFSTLNVPASIWAEIGIPLDVVRGVLAEDVFLLILVVIVIPTFAFLAQRATRFNSRILPTRFLALLILLSFCAAALARLCIL